MKTHELKIVTKYFEMVKSGVKRYELRYNDRGYEVGDILQLREWNEGEYSGRELIVKVDSMLREYEGLREGWVIMSISEMR